MRRKSAADVVVDSTCPSSSDTDSIPLKFLRSLQTIFSRQHFQQLRLDYPTNDFDPYSKIFLEVKDIDEIDSRVKKEAMALLKEQRIEVFLHFVNKLVSSNMFIGLALVQSILEVILTTNLKKAEQSDKTNRCLQSAFLLFEKIIDNFPPTWPVCSELYRKLLLEPINIEIDYKKIRMSSADGFFEIILALLRDALIDDSNDNDEGESNAFDSMMNFQQFERVENEKSCYKKLTRNERIDRLFLVLHLLVKLMEIDLSMWIQRYPFQTKNFMCDPNTCPLIGHFLWKGKEVGRVNSIMRNIFNTFTMSLWIEFPDDKTDILARLVSLMAVAVNLSEQCDDEKLISYPNIDKLMEAFALDLSKSIESFPYTVKFYINVISKIRTPVVGMFASIRILNKFLSVENCTLHTIVDDVGKRSYNRYNEVPDECEDRDRQSENYPVYDPSRSRATSKHITINRNEYLTLIFYLFKSYVEIYRTHDLLELLLANEVATTSDSNKQFNELREKAIRDRTQRIDYDKINWKQLRATDPIPQTPLQECRKVFLNASKFPKYQEDLHQLLKLKKLVGVTAVVEQEGSFKKFCEAVRGYLSIPDEKR